MRLAAQYKGGFYPTPERVVDLVAGLVHVPSSHYGCRETVRILDPCCGAGEALALLAERLGGPGAMPVETFGVELHTERAEQARERLDRTLAVDLFGTSIANGAFGILLLNPPYDWDSGEEKRVEHRFLLHTTRYLAEDGLLIFIVPRKRLTVSARYLASHYRRIRCWAFPEPEREAFDQVVLIGYRKAEPHSDPHAEEQIREWVDGENPRRCSPHRYPVYTAATTPTGDVLFATRTVDPGGRRRRGPTVGAVDLSPDDHGLAVALRSTFAHPTAHAPSARSHGHAGRRRVPRQPVPRVRRPEDPRKGPDLKGVRARRGHRREGDLPRETPHHRRLPRPRRRTDHRHRRIDGRSSGPQPRGFSARPEEPRSVFRREARTRTHLYTKEGTHR